MKYEFRGREIEKDEARRYVDNFPKTPYISKEEQAFKSLELHACVMMNVYGKKSYKDPLTGLVFVAE